jgi:hypothetical protein
MAVVVVVAPRAHAQIRRAVERREDEHPGASRSWRYGTPTADAHRGDIR